MSQATPRKAVALISGGLDSMLAAKLIQEQGIEVEGLNFYTGFCVEGHTHAIRQKDKAKPKRNNALWVAEQLGIKLHIVDIVEEYKQIVINPKFGYGQYLNPCLDCKVFMVQKAREWMEENGFDFIITGEVIGQRPMSQRKATMPIVSKRSGANERLVRPLCAHNLPETLPEQEGWLQRDQLLGITGRGRKQQMALAEKFGFEDYAQPAGGCCFLTNPDYSNKLQDMWQARGEKNYELEDVMLLKVGRHLRPKPNFKVIVGREEGENLFLEGFRKRYTHILIKSHDGPLIFVDGDPTAEDLILAARIAARFSAGREAESVEVSIALVSGETQEHTLAPLPVSELPKAWYL